MRRFCLLTSGRTGSTALMDVIAAVDGVAVPACDVDCIDHELLHPARSRGYAKYYSTQARQPIATGADLISAFYRCHSQSKWAGFKSMCNRHRNLARFIEREDIQFITLRRRDIPATVASFMLAMEQNTWRRDGGQPEQTWTFSDDNKELVLSNLAFVHQTHDVLDQISTAIALDYEDLCQPGFESSQLNQFFESSLFLPRGQPPTDASRYVTNWPTFLAFCRATLKELRG